jgi:hypothetical protein
MFYCEACAKKYGYPFELWTPMSKGPCEICKTMAVCADVPTSQLPDSQPSGADVVDLAMKSDTPVRTGGKPPGYGVCCDCESPLGMTGYCTNKDCDMANVKQDGSHKPQEFTEEELAEADMDEEEDGPCECEDIGYLFPSDLDTGFACVMKCDQCDKYKSDEEAAAAFGAELQKRDPDYAILNMVLPGLKWEDLGASKFVVAKRQKLGKHGTLRRNLDADEVFVPITDEEAIELAHRLQHTLGPVCCPVCGGTNLHVQLPAVFRWNGADHALGPEDLASCEFPIEDDAAVICNGSEGGPNDPCDHTCKVRDLKPKE